MLNMYTKTAENALALIIDKRALPKVVIAQRLLFSKNRQKQEQKRLGTLEMSNQHPHEKRNVRAASFAY